MNKGVKHVMGNRMTPQIHPLFLGLLATSLIFIGPGCRLDDNRLRGSIRIPVHGPDFKKTEIIENGPAAADGSSELILIVHLKNSDGSVVSSYRPEYEIAVGHGVIPTPCTESSKDGVSACVLRATQPGPKVLRLTNAKVGLEKEIHFESPYRKGRILGLISGSVTSAHTADNYWGEFSLGDWAQGTERETPGGYRAFFSVQGDLASQ